METDIYICFNPHCLSPNNQRVFTSSEDSLEHQRKCHHWIATPRHQQRIMNQSLSFHQNKQEEQLKLDSSPIESAIDFSQRKVVIREALLAIFESAKRQMCLFIDNYKMMKLKELERVNKDVETLKKLISTVLEAVQKENIINESVRVQTGELICEQWSLIPYKNLFLADLHLFSKEKIAEQLPQAKHKLQQIFDSLITERRLDGQLETVNIRDIKKAQSFLLDNNEMTCQQKFTKLFNWDISEYYVGNIAQNQIKCPQCQFQQIYPRTKKSNNVNLLTRALAEHLTTAHRPLIGHYYAQRLKKDPPQQLEFDTILYLMKSQNFKELEIIDGSNLKSFTLDICPTKLSITFSQVVPSENQRECSWMEVGSPEEAAYYTVLLIYEVAIKMKKVLKIVGFKKQYHALFTRIVACKQLEDRFIIEDKIKILKNPNRAQSIHGKY